MCPIMSEEPIYPLCAFMLPTVCFVERRNTQQTISKQDTYCPWDKAAASMVQAVCQTGWVEALGHNRARSASPLQRAAGGPAGTEDGQRPGDAPVGWHPGTWGVRQRCVRPRARRTGLSAALLQLLEAMGPWLACCRPH